MARVSDEFRLLERNFDKIVGKPARRISACLAVFRQLWPTLSRIKAPPPIIPSETIRSRAGYTSLGDVRTMGSQMGTFGHSHGWRVILLVSGMVCFGPAANLTAGTLVSPGAMELIRQSAEPFGLFVSKVSAGALREKWLGVERKLDDERVQLALCDGDRERCVSPAALALLAIVDAARTRDGRARLGEVNRAINLAIRPM